MSNLALFVLFWTSVPLALYRSPRRWRTFFFCIGTWFAATLLLGILLASLATFTSGDPARFSRVASDAAWLVAILVCVWHSSRARQAAGAPVPPSVIV